MTSPPDNVGNLEEQRAFQETYARARQRLEGLKYVVGVGLGSKHTGGAFTTDLAIIVFVREKRPVNDLAPEDRVPETFEGYKTDVRVAERPRPGVCDNRSVYEKIQGGIQISLKVTMTPSGPGLLPGTLSCVVRRRNDPSHENAYILSNKHVLYGTNSGANDYVYHPYPPEQGANGVTLGPVMAGGVFANVPFLLNPGSTPINVFLDCAVARLDIDSKCCGSTCTKDKLEQADTIIDLNLNGVNTMSDVRNAVSNPAFKEMEVWKVGRTTGRTKGKIKLIDATFFTSDPTFAGSPLFNAQNTLGIAFEPEPGNLKNCHGNTWFAEVGDSGSVVVNAQNHVLGIITHVPTAAAAPDALSYACHIVPVLDRLGICIPCSPGGSHGTTAAIDGSGLQPSSKNPPHAADVPLSDGQIIFAGHGSAAAAQSESALPALMHLTDDEARVMQARLRDFRATARGRALHDAFGQLRREVGYLIRNVRPVTVAWHRGKGPAFMTHVLNHLAGHTDRIPHEVQGVTRGELLTRMRDVLSARGSNPLREALAHYGDDLFVAATDPDCHTIEDCSALLQMQDV
jgi:hypothetical protein